MCRECNAVFFTAFNSGLSLLPGEPNIFPAFSRAWQLSERKCCFIMFVVDVFCCIFFFIVSVRFGWVNLQNFQTLITKKLKIITSSSSFSHTYAKSRRTFNLTYAPLKTEYIADKDRSPTQWQLVIWAAQLQQSRGKNETFNQIWFLADLINL